MATTDVQPAHSFFTTDFMPHGHCFFWRPDILWTTVLADLLITLAYFSIPVALIILVTKRRDMEFKGALILFAAFITFCGITHLFSIFTLWHGYYGIQSLLKLATGLISMATAIYCFRNIHSAVAYPSIQEHKRALELAEYERLQRESVNRLNRAINAIDDGIWEWNVQTNQVWFSDRICRLLGASPDEEVTIELWQNHIHPDEKNKVLSLLDKHFKQHEKFDINYRGKTSDNEYRWLNIRGNTLFGDGGVPLLMSGSLSDIHDRIELQHTLTIKSNFLNQVLNKSLAGMYIYSFEEKRNTYVNPAYANITGYDLSKFQALSESDAFFSLFHPDDIDMIHAHIKQVSETKKSDDNAVFDLEYRMKHKDGSWVWCYSRDSIYSFDEQGRPLEMIGTFIDITAFKEREHEISRLSRAFSTTFNQAAVGIAHVSFDGCFIKVNKKLCEILNRPEDTLLNLHVTDVTVPEDKEKSKEIIRGFKESEVNSGHFEKRYFKADGTVVWAELTIAKVQPESNNDTGYFIAVIEDISRRKETEEKLVESNNALEKFAYSVSHDLQEPARKISVFSQMLRKDLDPSTLSKDTYYQIDRIIDASKRMSKMIQGLLDLSRQSRRALIKEPIRLSEIIAITTQDLSSRIEETGTSIVISQDGELYVDDIIKQVFQNLILNSINYRKKNAAPVITIELENTKKTSIITISDNGIGFHPSQSKDIFTPFKRLDKSYCDGSGMGLTLCKQLVEAHNGTIEAESDMDGATFKITIPRAECPIGSELVV